MLQVRIPAVFMRGGTSKAVIFHHRDLPADVAARDAIFLDVIGSPDANGRQLDGMGGGVSSLSKVYIVGPPTRPGADVDYTFAQISITAATVDYSLNCGNMSSAIGPFAVEEGLVAAPAEGDARVRIHNTNTGKIIVAHFPVWDGQVRVDGDLSIDGVSGTGAPIRLDFEQPGGAGTGRLLPAGLAMTVLEVAGLGTVEASMVDAANPCVFVAASSVGKIGLELPDVLELDRETLGRLEAIRQAASVAMGITGSLPAAPALKGIPFVAMVTGPAAARTLSGREVAAGEVDLIVRMMSSGQPHRAVPITGGLCLAVASRIPGSIPATLVRAGAATLRIGHPSGVTVVDADVVSGPFGPEARAATVYRTARRLFEGHVRVRAGVLGTTPDKKE